jgi:hypothetical protein
MNLVTQAPYVVCKLQLSYNGPTTRNLKVILDKCNTEPVINSVFITTMTRNNNNNNNNIITDRNIPKNRHDIVTLAKTTKEAHSIDVAIPNSHNLLSTITEKLQKYTDLKEELIRIWQL